MTSPSSPFPVLSLPAYTYNLTTLTKSVYLDYLNYLYQITITRVLTITQLTFNDLIIVTIVVVTVAAQLLFADFGDELLVGGQRAVPRYKG